MEMGQRIRRARLDAGLSQRQLCGEKITRNMLSLIESGSAKPSMDTLCYLAERLNKPVSYFLEEQAVTSMNQERMAKAREASGEAILEIFRDYRQPDPVFDRERWLMEALCCMDLGEQALKNRELPLARAYLRRAAEAGSRTPYYREENERKRLLLLAQAEPEALPEILEQLPDPSQETVLRAKAFLQAGDGDRCAGLLDAMAWDGPDYWILRGDCAVLQGDYTLAATCYQKAEKNSPHAVYAKLEDCFRELGDYKMAYMYACKQREEHHDL